MTGRTARKMSPMRTAKVIVSVGAALIAALAIGAIAAVSSMTVTRPAPDVTFNGISGDSYSTTDLHGKVVVVNFWATWCPDCVKEMPKLVDTHRKFAGRGYETIAVAVRQDELERVRQFTAKNGLPFKVAFDRQGAIAREFGNVRITPTTFVIDRKGKIVQRYVGEPDWSKLQQLIERELRP
jgi:peroxiredoxin